MSYAEIQKLLPRGELQKMKQNRELFAIRLRIGFNATKDTSAGEDTSIGIHELFTSN